MPTEQERVLEAEALMPEAVRVYMIVRQTARHELTLLDTTDVADALELELRTVRKAIKALACSRVGLIKVHGFDAHGRCQLLLPYFEPRRGS